MKKGKLVVTSAVFRKNRTCNAFSPRTNIVVFGTGNIRIVTAMTIAVQQYICVQVSQLIIRKGASGRQIPFHDQIWPSFSNLNVTIVG